MTEETFTKLAWKTWSTITRLIALPPAVAIAWFHQLSRDRPSKMLACSVVLPMSAIALTVQGATKVALPPPEVTANGALSVAAVAQPAVEVSTTADPSSQKGYIAKASWDGAWPFAVEDGVLDCMYWASVGFKVPGDDGSKAVAQRNADFYGLEALIVFRTAQGIYTINDRAKNRAEQYGWKSLSPDSSMWLEYPNIPGVKVSLGPVLKAGLQLCFNES